MPLEGDSDIPLSGLSDLAHQEDLQASLCVTEKVSVAQHYALVLVMFSGISPYGRVDWRYPPSLCMEQQRWRWLVA
jgi:hypothetical protein